jgi:eukaryotic translation initiation factor 2C
MNVIVNAFNIAIPDGTIYHYDVVVNADSKKLPPRVNMLLFDRLQKVVAPNVFTPPAVYDCRSNAFATHKLKLGPNDSATFDVTMEREGPPSKDARPPKIYRIKLTKVAEINTEILHRFINGKISQDNAITTSITALNIVIRMGPNLQFPFNSRSFFTEEGSRSIGGGMELWRGYFQSIRPSQAKMYLNLDIATGVMFKKGNLIGLCLEYLKTTDTGRLSPQKPSNPGGLNDRDRISLQRFITNLRVSTSHGGRTQTRAIKKLTPQGANECMFTMREGGRSLSVADYFRRELNKPLKYPNLICIEVGSGAKIPLELCTVPAGQIMRKQIPADKTNEVVEFSKLTPRDRLASIRHGLGVLSHGQSEYVREFGMAVDPDPIVVKARVIAPPVLRYGPGSRELTIRPANGQWNMRDKKFYKPHIVKSWFIVIYEIERQFNRAMADSMANAFCASAESVGMKVEDRKPLVFYETGHGNIIDQLRKNGTASYQQKKEAPSLIVVVLPEGGNHIYTAVKHFGDIIMGVATQCLKSQKVKKGGHQYWANVMLKVNVKLGGINNVVENSFLSDEMIPTIVMGADVIHPAPGAEGRPSFASLVSSVDIMNAKYISCSRVQGGRLEIIEDMGGMVKEVLTSYIGYATFEKRKKRPARLIFYRDGVSEPQFQHVLDQELPLIKSMSRFSPVTRPSFIHFRCMRGYGHYTQDNFDYRW